MKDYKNEGGIDRMVRVIVAEVLLMAGYLWLSGIWQVAAYVVGVIALITAATGFCTAYKILGTNTRDNGQRPVSWVVKSIFAVVFLLIAAVGIYYANF